MTDRTIPSSIPSLLLPTCIGPGANATHVSSLSSSFKWGRCAFMQIARLLEPLSFNVEHIFGNRTIRISTGFSGIGAVELAATQLGLCANTFVDANNAGGTVEKLPFAFVHVYALENNRKSQEELLSLPDPPEHLFDDVFNHIRSCDRKLFGLDDSGGGEDCSMSFSELRQQVKIMVPTTDVWCAKCGGTCTMQTSDIHIAGSPCTDFSMKGLRCGEHGPQMYAFLAWVILRLYLKDKIIVHENVVQMGIALLEELLGHMYIVWRIVICPTSLGWQAKRDRQYCVLVRKDLFSMNMQATVDSGFLHKALLPEEFCNRFRELLWHIFGKTADWKWSELFFSTPDIIENELEWARSRKSVKERASLADDKFGDRVGTAAAALHINERRRLEAYKVHVFP